MAKHILKFDEYQGSSKDWHCIASAEIGKIGNQWYTPARALGMKLDEYVEMLIRDFHPDHIQFYNNSENGLLLFSWKSQTDMRKYKNWINKKMRDRKFYVE